MPTFAYAAIDTTGAPVEGVTKADTIGAARAILVEEYGTEPSLARSGGSIPVTALFLESLGAYTVSFGFGLDDERQHSPNEFFRLSNFVRGQRAYCKLLHGLAG